MLPLKLIATMSARCAVLAWTMSHNGVCTPSDTQQAPSSANMASAISRPRPWGSPGNVVSSTRGRAPAGGSGMLAMATRNTACMASVYMCSSKTFIWPRTHASPTAVPSGLTTSVTKRATPWRDSERLSSVRKSAISWRRSRPM